MTKYQYEEGKTYLSESTPITVSRIPSGTYKISVRKDDAVGEYTFTTAPGTQKVSIMAINTPLFDFSNLEVSYSRAGSSGDYTHTWTVSGVGLPEDYSSYRVSVEIGNSAGDSFVIGQTPENFTGGTHITDAGEIYCSFMSIGTSDSYSDYVEIYEIKVYDSSDALVQTFPSAPKGDWDLSGARLGEVVGLNPCLLLSGVNGSSPPAAKMVWKNVFTVGDEFWMDVSGGVVEDLTYSIPITGTFRASCTIIIYDANENELARNNVVPIYED